MKALLKVEWLQAWRNWTIFIMAIGMPVGFFIFYSGMDMYANPAQQKAFVQSYMLTMTSFSMSSFGFFTFPFMLAEDRTSHWLSYLEHSKLPIWKYYLSKMFRVLVYFLCSITVTFLVGGFYRGVSLSVSGWLGSLLLLLLTGLLFLAFGLLISQIASQQVMSIVANITFLALAIIGGSWMPIETFPKWVQAISKWTPVYHVNQTVVTFAAKGILKWQSLLITLAYAIIIAGLALIIKQKQEVTSV